MEPTIDHLVSCAARNIPQLNEARLRDGYAFAEAAHAGQLRNSGEPYIIHPLAAAITLTDLHVDEDTLIACLLHDVPEDTDRTSEEIGASFGPAVRALVDGVTKLSKVHYKNDMEQHQVENLRKMFLVMAEDLRVVLIKLADRLHNMQTLRWVRPEKRVRIARETLEIYAPLADRLGIGFFKWQLEDLCFRHLHPLEEAALRESLSEGQAEREALVQRVKASLAREIRSAGIEKAEIDGRTKHLYSVFRKMQLKGKALDEIYDLFALRVLVPSVKDCYAVLGVVHDLWKPKPGRFKDYIAVPKTNGYQSLHTTVFCVGGRLTEFQIRTFDMHREAEYGVPAHWHYDASKGTARGAGPQREWVKSILELQETARDSREFIESVKLDVFHDRIFVFTPRGDVLDLPKGAVALDFSYAVHSDVGHRTTGLKVNGSIATLGTRLATGDVVEVITSKTPAPKRDWLSLVQTSQARTKIRSWFRGQDRGKNVEVGRTILNRVLEQAGKGRVEKLPEEKLRAALDALSLRSEEELLAAVGDGTYSPFQVLKRMFLASELLTELPTKVAKRSRNAAPRVIIQGSGDLEVRVAKCCTPGVGDKLVGFVTKSKMITVHAPTCRSVKHLDPERLIHAAWETTPDARSYVASVRIEATDRATLARDILLAVSQLDVRILRLETAARSEGETAVRLDVELANLDALARLYEALGRIAGVTDVLRVGG